MINVFISHIVNEIPGAPGFLTPVFSSKETKYFQVCENGRIIDFQSIDNSNVGEELCAPETIYTIGDEEVFGFLFSPEQIVVGSKCSIAAALRDRIKLFTERPFLLLGIAEFLKDQQLMELAFHQIQKLENHLHEATRLHDWQPAEAAALTLRSHRPSRPDPGRAAVAVVIPCYRQAHLLGEALTSCLEQEPRPAEIIVVDDGSPDDVGAAVSAFDDPRIRLVWRPNGGLSAARNTGLVASTSPFVVFLDADDTLRPGALAAGLACHAAQPAAAFVWGGFQNMDAKGRPFGRTVLRRPKGEPLIDIMIGNIVGMHGAVMYRRAPLVAAGGFDEALRTFEDWDMYLRLAKEHPVACHDAIVANYRRHGNTITGNYDGMLRGGLTMLEHFRPPLGEAPELARAWRLGRARFVGRNMRKALLAGLSGLRRGQVRPLLRAIRTVVRYTWFLLPSTRPGFAVRAVARQVLQTRPSAANGDVPSRV